MDITEDFLTNSSELKFKEMRAICLTLGNIHVKKNPSSLVCLRWQPQRLKCAYRLAQTPVFQKTSDSLGTQSWLPKDQTRGEENSPVSYEMDYSRKSESR